MKTAVITGGTRGLGFELAKQFRMNGLNIALCGTNQNGLDKALQQLRQVQGEGDVFGQVCNVADPESVECLAQAAAERFGGIDYWINNAGVNQSFAYAWELQPDEVDFLLGVDLKGAIYGTNAAIKQMIRQGCGAVYNVEGMGSNDAYQSRFALYGTAKRAVTYYSVAAAKEAEEKKLPVIIGRLSPGIMITDFLTSAKGQQNATALDEKTKKVYNILGDRPDVIAEFLVREMLKNTKNNAHIVWLTGRKAAWRFMTAGKNKRDFFKD